MSGHGRLVQCGGDGKRVIGPLWSIISAKLSDRFVSQSLCLVNTAEDTATLEEIRGLLEAGSLRGVIDRSYPLQQAGEAVRLVEEGSPRGKVVVSVP